MRKALGKIVRRVLRHFGFSLLRTDEFDRLRRDPFKVQQQLLANRSPKTILDVGGHYGETVAEYARIFPEATIHSFEPSPRSFEQLVHRLSSCPRVRPVQAAVSDAPGSRQFFENVLNGTNSLLAFAPGMADWYPGCDTTVETYEVPVVTLDSYCREQGMAYVDLLKMDIQGGEMSALRGAHDLLASHAIGIVYTEIFFVSHYQGDSLLHEVWRHLEDHGYGLFDLFVTAHAQEGAGQVLQGDAIFVAPGIVA